MKFAIVSSKNTKRISEVLDMFGYDIDRIKPDYVITYGGEGTILYAERIFPGIPKITLRETEEGYKCKFAENELEDVLLKIENGEHKIQEELKLESEYKGKRYLSLNEVQLHNPVPNKAIRFSVYLDDNVQFDNVIGDGVVIATPYGSTAYFLSVGGVRFDKGINSDKENKNPDKGTDLDYFTRFIGIVLNNPYKFDDNVQVSTDSRIKLKEDGCIIVDPISVIKIKALREEGLLLFDNDDKLIKVKEGDEITIRASKDIAKFVI